MNIKVPHYDFGGTGPLLHFAHANGFPPGCYQTLLKGLSTDFHVLAMRQRPLWDGSNPNKFKTWEILGDDLIRFLEENNLQNIIGVGHSMGGIATVIAAAKRPVLFSQVILIDPVLFLNNIYSLNKFTPIWLRKKMIPVAKIALKRKDSWPTKQMAFDSLRSKKIFELIPDKIFSEFMDGSIKENDAGVASLIYSKEWEAQVYCTPTNAWPYLAKLNQPTLAIKASGSNLLYPPVWEKWQEVQPDARFETVEKSSHLLPLERPEIVVDLVCSFLGKK